MSNPPDHQQLAHRLEQVSGIVEWRLLKPHYQRDALIVIRAGVDLISVGVQIASDNQAQVKQWIGDQSLAKPTREQVEQWERDNPCFRSVVVAPFVLMQAVKH